MTEAALSSACYPRPGAFSCRPGAQEGPNDPSGEVLGDLVYKAKEIDGRRVIRLIGDYANDRVGNAAHFMAHLGDGGPFHLRAEQAG